MDVISWGLFFIGVNGASVVRRFSGVWVTGCIHVESVTCVRKCDVKLHNYYYYYYYYYYYTIWMSLVTVLFCPVLLLNQR